MGDGRSILDMPLAFSDQPSTLVANLPHVGRELVERLQLARVRAFERELEIREERGVGGDFGGASAVGRRAGCGAAGWRRRRREAAAAGRPWGVPRARARGPPPPRPTN